jgi:hypothetical protein
MIIEIRFLEKEKLPFLLWWDMVLFPPSLVLTKMAGGTRNAKA